MRAVPAIPSLRTCHPTHGEFFHEFNCRCLAFAVGYAAAVYSWSAVRTWITGAEAEIRVLEDKLNSLKAEL
jgi:hypothetical protein